MIVRLLVGFALVYFCGAASLWAFILWHRDRARKKKVAQAEAVAKAEGRYLPPEQEKLLDRLADKLCQGTLEKTDFSEALLNCPGEYRGTFRNEWNAIVSLQSQRIAHGGTPSPRD